MKRLLIVLCLLPSLVLAGEPASLSEKLTLMDAVHGNASAGLRTFTFALGNQTSATAARQMAILHFNADYTDGLTAVSMVCSASDDSGTTLFVLQECTMSSGTCTSSGVTWSKAIAAADTKWVWRVDATGYAYLSCVVTMTGGTANEHLTVTGWMSSK